MHLELRNLILVTAVAAASFILSPLSFAKGQKTSILVEKKTNTLSVAIYENGEYKIIKQYKATLGKVKGDKEEEKDLKTPEGIYTFNSRENPPSLPAKFGISAFSLNFPNAYDRIAGHAGHGIMLHATNDPDRLKQNYDSEGCVVVKNEELKEIIPYIRLGLTPILIFPETTPEPFESYLKPGSDAKLKAVFADWVSAWESRDVNRYINHYHSDFSAQGKNKAQWKAYKSQLITRYAAIKVGPEDIQYYRHPKYSVVTFTQNYQSRLKNGAFGHRSRGTKILYIAEEAGAPKIIAETYTTLMW